MTSKKTLLGLLILSFACASYAADQEDENDTKEHNFNLEHHAPGNTSPYYSFENNKVFSIKVLLIAALVVSGAYYIHSDLKQLVPQP